MADFFTKELASITAEDFIDTYLVTGLKAKHVIVGDDFRFGRGAKGTPELLAKEGKAKGFSVDVIDEVQDSQAGRVSSTLIREALKNGDVQLAEALLGHAHKVRGQVVHGEARGRELGVPTANLGPLAGHDQIEGMVPKDGVYAGWARVRGKDYPTAISVGNNPTFTPDAKSQVEAHLLGFSGDLYGAEIEIAFKHRVRDMQKFNSIELLIERMQSDLKQVSELLSIS